MNVRDVLAWPEGTQFTGKCSKCGEDHDWTLDFMRDQTPDMDLSNYPLQKGQESIRVIWQAVGGPGTNQPCGLTCQFQFTHCIAQQEGKRP